MDHSMFSTLHNLSQTEASAFSKNAEVRPYDDRTHKRVELLPVLCLNATQPSGYNIQSSSSAGNSHVEPPPPPPAETATSRNTTAHQEPVVWPEQTQNTTAQRQNARRQQIEETVSQVKQIENQVKEIEQALKQTAETLQNLLDSEDGIENV